jgi:hypothetical protein
VSNVLYDFGRQGFLDGSIDYDTATIKVSLVNGYTFGSSHEFVSDVTATGTLVATQTLTSKTTTAGVANAANVTFPSVPVTTACNNLIIYQSSAPTGGVDLAATAQRLIAFIDTAGGLPVTPNGGDINLNWDTGVNKIWKL